MATVTLSELIAGIETALTAAPSLGLHLGDSVEGEQPQQLRHMGVWVQREASVNLNETRNRSESRIEDTIRVDLSYRLRPKAQRTDRNAAYDLAHSVQNRLTDRDNSDLASLYVIYESESEAVTGEWLVLSLRFSTRRYVAVGG